MGQARNRKQNPGRGDRHRTLGVVKAISTAHRLIKANHAPRGRRSKSHRCSRESIFSMSLRPERSPAHHERSHQEANVSHLNSLSRSNLRPRNSRSHRMRFCATKQCRHHFYRSRRRRCVPASRDRSYKGASASLELFQLRCSWRVMHRRSASWLRLAQPNTAEQRQHVNSHFSRIVAIAKTQQPRRHLGVNRYFFPGETSSMSCVLTLSRGNRVLSLAESKSILPKSTLRTRRLFWVW